MKKANYIVLGLVLAFQVGFISTSDVSSEEAPAAERWGEQSFSKLEKKVKTLKDPFERAAAYEALEQYEKCALSAKQVSEKSPVIDWVHVLELRCAIMALEEEKVSPDFLIKIVDRMEHSAKNLSEKEKTLLIDARLHIVNALVSKSKWKTVQSQIEKAFKYEIQMTKVQRSELYFKVGEVMIAERKWVEAYAHFMRAKDLDSELYIDGKVKNIIHLLPQGIREKYEALKNKTAAPEEKPPIPSTEEQKQFDQVQLYLSKEDTVSAVEAMVNLLKKFPLGVKSKWCQDKIFELLQKEEEKSRGPQGNSVIKNKIIKLMLDLDADRLADWAKMLFETQSYQDSALLYEKAAELVEKAARASKYIYMAARSFQLNQDFDQAKEYFRKLTKFYSASPEFIDGSIQWALVNINEKEYSEAITHLEMARSRKMTSQQDLTSLFWLFQCYKLKNEEQLKNKSALDLVTRFPLTYYGLIAYFELNQKLPVFEKSSAPPLKLSLSAQEWEVLKRAKILLKAGLIDEAGEDLQFLTQRKLDMEEELYYSRFFAGALDYPKVFSFLTSIYDENPKLRSQKLVSTLFPKEFWQFVSDTKIQSGVDPFLILALMRQESAFKIKAVSRSGAIGLMQMIPPTAEEVKLELGDKIDIPEELFNPINNIKFCAYYLSKLIRKFNGDIPFALAAYNAGPRRISQFLKAQGAFPHDTWLDELPLGETTFYVKSILKNYILYKILYEGQTQLGTPPWNAPSAASK